MFSLGQTEKTLIFDKSKVLIERAAYACIKTLVCFVFNFISTNRHADTIVSAACYLFNTLIIILKKTFAVTRHTTEFVLAIVFFS